MILGFFWKFLSCQLPIGYCVNTKKESMIHLFGTYSALALQFSPNQAFSQSSTSSNFRHTTLVRSYFCSFSLALGLVWPPCFGVGMELWVDHLCSYITLLITLAVKQVGLVLSFLNKVNDVSPFFHYTTLTFLLENTKIIKFSA